MRLIRVYYQFVFKYSGRYVVFLVAWLLGVSLEAVSPFFYKLFVDQIISGSLDQIWLILGALITTRLSSLAVGTLAFFLADWFIIPAARDIRKAVFKKIQALDFAYHTSKSTGSLISAFKRGDSAIFSLHDILDLKLIEIAVQLFVMLFFLSQVHSLTLVVMLAAVGVNLVATTFLIRYNIKTRGQFNDSEDEVSDIITDNLLNFETVKLFAKEHYEQNRLHTKFIEWSRNLWRFSNSFRLIDIVVGGIGNSGFVMVMGLGVWQLTQENISAGEFVMVLAFVSNFYWKFYELTFRLRDLAKFMTDAKKYLLILDEPETVIDPNKPVKKTSVKGDISFEDVTFTYRKGKDALSDFNLRIKPGQTVALVGHSGAGKSTVVKLLLRFFDPDQGKVMIDGVDLRDFKKTDFRSFIGVVPQDPILFNTTIKHNITYGASSVSAQELYAAAKMANISDFVEELPEKYATRVGERGIKLSGGQKQRLAIARMVLSDPEIVIFDEATSQLDSESERQIQEAFWKATKDKTTLIIAHRLSTVVRADKIVVMDQGRIIETGSHRDLLRQKGKYAQFWKLQTLG